MRQTPDLVTLRPTGTPIRRALATAVERALCRLGDKLLPPRQRVSTAPTRARVHLLRALARLPASGESVAFLAGALEDDEPRVRRAAVRGLGKARGGSAGRAEEALLASWNRLGERMDGPERRAVLEALGKLGAQGALALLEGAGERGRGGAEGSTAAAPESDAQFERVAARARMRIERSVRRRSGGRIAAERRVDSAIPIVYLVREGLGPILEAEIEELFRADRAVQRSARRAAARPRAGRNATRPRLARRHAGAGPPPRVALAFGFPLGRRTIHDANELAGVIAERITSDEARRIFSTWTEGTVRYRLSFRGGGHRRALVFRVASEVSARAPELLNDPTESLWDVIVDDGGENGRRPGDGRARSVSVELLPRAIDDARFAYRTSDVPAASHPTLAAALARVADVRRSDVVWDPFVGSGTELVECALRGSPQALFGTDLDPRALDAARANLTAAGVHATLEARSALEFTPRGVTLIVTNPPMGLRVERTKELGETLERFVTHAGAVLQRGGRLVWLSPFASRLRPGGGERTRARSRARVVWAGSRRRSRSGASAHRPLRDRGRARARPRRVGSGSGLREAAATSARARSPTAREA